MVDPEKLDYMVTLKYFTDYYRSKASGSKHYSSDEIDERYQEYKQNFRGRQHTAFFTAHQEDDWFREKYHPKARAARLHHLSMAKVPRYEHFVRQLEAGAFDNVSMDEPPKGDGETAEPVQNNPDHETHTLFIKTIPPSIGRQRLEEFCSTVPGFQYLALTEANPTKKFHRFGWVKFSPNTDMDTAHQQLDRAKIDEFQFHFNHHQPSSTQQTRLASDICNTPERLTKDLATSKALIETLDAEVNGALAEDVVPRFEGERLLEVREASLLIARGENPEGGEADDASVPRLKLQLDIRLAYLRAIHYFCYYCGSECESAEDFARKCGAHHYRRQPQGAVHKSQSTTNWLAGLDERLAMRTDPSTGAELERMGGKSLDKELEAMSLKHIEKVEEGKYRCALCSKLFKGEAFVVKHIRNKHPDAIQVGDLEENTAFFNNYVRDSRRYQTPATGMLPGQLPGAMGYGFSNPMMGGMMNPAMMMNMGGNGAPGRGMPPGMRADPRQMRSYVDLDAPAEGDMGADNNFL
ncbi:hypothetical protein BJ085DRAFT_14053 [Dimargaris cristalligena]|uniref:C2H2-type domain-containing protein n=1 Tax=Dimargaris cristalligena TaxID=215637 RepID=A0A4V1J4D3_9FUNG|nr:hypothetical protein BJ085DRAFT_14053 [Dimargaris cristalligena]|eukprot:RKP35159.1 hypothetical protein BJ085DRAFT_14053 [Dimargaris cristalligena]